MFNALKERDEIITIYRNVDDYLFLHSAVGDVNEEVLNPKLKEYSKIFRHS